MKSATVLEKIDDALNPIVVKELRQGVQSRFVVAVLLLFLLLQLMFMGIFLVVWSIGGQLDSTEFQAGREVFAVLQGILLATCMVFIPAYTGMRLGAERSDVHVDLFFITTLRPRSIIAGKFVAAIVLAILIFSACMPFMAFTYFLRGIDLPSIFFVIALDFLVVTVTVMLAIFLAVIPTNRILKALLGLIGLFIGLMTFGYTLGGTIMLVEFGVASMLESREFWYSCLIVVLNTVGSIGLMYTWSVGLLSPPSANRTLPMRLWVTLLWLVSGVAMTYFSRQVGEEWPLAIWIFTMCSLLSLCLVIACNERERWAPRVSRTIPKSWWLRPFAFLFYSGAAGGIIWACVLVGLTWISYPLLRQLLPVSARRLIGPGGTDVLNNIFQTMGVMFAYTYCYALTAIFLRNTILRIHPVYTWVLWITLVALGSAIPFLLTFLLHQRGWSFTTHYTWLLTAPPAGMAVVGDSRMILEHATVFLFLFAWAALVTLLNAAWFFRQIYRFRPFVPTKSQVREMLPDILAPTPMEATRTIP
jgi:hypothetical protein